ncbi:MAG: terminase large subunit domain-containing protein [Desulfuromonadaceae bacterium]
MEEIRPQAGPQEDFLSTPADIAIYGGAAGGGKSWALLMEPLRHVTRLADFTAMFFRRNAVQVKNPGGLWDESVKLYPLAGAVPVSNVMQWNFPGGGVVKFGHLENETSVFNWQGSQLPLICFDELTHFSITQFFYMLSRNRSTCGVRPYIRATTNPDVDSWVAEFIAWWINQTTGFPIPERAGKLRWFIRLNNKLIWADTEQELKDAYGTVESPVFPKSVTFIPASIYDNKKLMEADPGYLANLQAQDDVQRSRLLDGNWLTRRSVNGIFRKEWLKFTDIRPATLNVYIMGDPADSKKKGSDNTAIAVIGVDGSRNKYLLDGFCHKMNLSERWDALRQMRRKWLNRPGVQLVWVGYEKYGMQSDLQYFEEKMRDDGDSFTIKELNWSQNSGQSKEDRVQRLVPDFKVGKFFLIAAAEGETKNQRMMREAGEGFRVLVPVKQKDHEGNLYALNQRFLNEYLNFPTQGVPDDLIDAVSRLYDMEYSEPQMYDEGMLVPEAA